MKKLVIIEASDHGKVVADIARNNGYTEILFLDDNEELSRCGGYPVEEKTSEFKNYDCDIIVAISNVKIQREISTADQSRSLAGTDSSECLCGWYGENRKSNLDRYRSNS